MSKLLEYFNTVDKDAVARATHFAAPLKSMSEFGLNADEQKAVMSGDIHGFAGALGVTETDLPVIHVPLTIFPPSQLAQAGKTSIR